MTAVEFLESQYKFNQQLFKSDFQQAKEMEKEQMCNYISFGAELKKSMEEKVYDDIKKSLEELVKQGKLKNYTNYKSE